MLHVSWVRRYGWVVFIYIVFIFEFLKENCFIYSCSYLYTYNFMYIIFDFVCDSIFLCKWLCIFYCNKISKSALDYFQVKSAILFQGNVCQVYHFVTCFPYYAVIVFCHKYLDNYMYMIIIIWYRVHLHLPNMSPVTIKWKHWSLCFA